VVGAGGLTALWLMRGSIFALLERSGDLARREGIWDAVLARAGERPAIGWGFSTPWGPGIDEWLGLGGQAVGEAHSMWLDVLLQLGVVGVVLMGLTYLAFVWRSWFFAVDRPRFDLRADRPYSPLTLLPTLVATVLLVFGLAESSPLMLWGWMLLAMLAFKIKQSPLIGVGPAEQTLAMERGEALEGSATQGPPRADR
jgi:exopolysaccharide production protein ExoQ